MERWVGSARRECLDRLLIVGRRQLEHVLRVYMRHYNRGRPHRALDLRPPDRLETRPSVESNSNPSDLRVRRRELSAASSTNTRSPQQRDDRVLAPHALTSRPKGLTAPVRFALRLGP